MTHRSSRTLVVGLVGAAVVWLGWQIALPEQHLVVAGGCTLIVAANLGWLLAERKAWRQRGD